MLFIRTQFFIFVQHECCRMMLSNQTSKYSQYNAGLYQLHLDHLYDSLHREREKNDNLACDQREGEEV